MRTNLRTPSVARRKCREQEMSVVRRLLSVSRSSVSCKRAAGEYEYISISAADMLVLMWYYTHAIFLFERKGKKELLELIHGLR